MKDWELWCVAKDAEPRRTTFRFWFRSSAERAACRLTRKVVRKGLVAAYCVVDRRIPQDA